VDRCGLNGPAPPGRRTVATGEAPGASSGRCAIRGQVRAQRTRPAGAADCSHGWSDAAFGVAQPVGAFVLQYVRPNGAEEWPGRAADQSSTYRSSNSTPCAVSIRRSSDRKSFAPPGRKREKRMMDSFPSSDFHGLRDGPYGRAAPPVATSRRPRGATDRLSGAPPGLGGTRRARIL